MPRRRATRSDSGTASASAGIAAPNDLVDVPVRSAAQVSLPTIPKLDLAVDLERLGLDGAGRSFHRRTSLDPAGTSTARSPVTWAPL